MTFLSTFGGENRETASPSDVNRAGDAGVQQPLYKPDTGWKPGELRSLATRSDVYRTLSLRKTDSAERLKLV